MMYPVVRHAALKRGENCEKRVEKGPFCGADFVDKSSFLRKYFC